MSFHQIWSIFYDNFDLLLSGLWVTVQVSVMAFAISVFAGLALCMGTISRTRALRWPAVLVMEFCRNTPILVQLVWVHFAWPEILGVTLTPWQSAVTALALQSSGYLAEEFRAGIESIDRGQVEAAQSLGMTYTRLMYRIVVPQAVIRVLPGILNQFVTCFKSSSVVSIIAVPDIMYYASLIVSETFLPMPVYTIVALIYFLMVMGISYLMRLATRRLPNFGYFHSRLEPAAA
jgi:His/Glu/Gln/Arg/opine family amino acid ABC transporter permease subunit